MDLFPIIIASVLTAAAAGAPPGQHQHTRKSLPSSAETCSCVGAVIGKSECVLENSAGACVLRADWGVSCRTWHCHPAAVEAHKSPWKPGKANTLKPLPAEKAAAPAGTDACARKVAKEGFPAPISGPHPNELAGCQEWMSEPRVDYPSVDGRADCSRPIPTLVTRCTAVLDPAFQLTRTEQKGSECHCAEWTALKDARSCTAYICRPAVSSETIR